MVKNILWILRSSVEGLEIIIIFNLLVDVVIAEIPDLYYISLWLQFDLIFVIDLLNHIQKFRICLRYLTFRTHDFGEKLWCLEILDHQKL